MKAITVNAYWAHMILCGEATALFLPETTDYRGPLVLCSANAPEVVNTIVGEALCLVNLVEVVPFKAKHQKISARDKLPTEPGYAWIFDSVQYLETFPVADGEGLFDLSDDAVHPFAPDITPEDFTTAFNTHYKDKFVEGYRPVREGYIGAINPNMEWDLIRSDFDALIPEMMPLPMPARGFRKAAKKSLHRQIGTGYGFWCWQGTRKEVEQFLRSQKIDLTPYRQFLSDYATCAIMLVDHFYL